VPGFVVGGVGRPAEEGGIATNVEPFYSYTWKVPSLFPGDDYRPGVTIFTKDCTLPTFSAGREEVDGANLIYKYASMVNWEDVRISFYDIPFRGEIFAERLKEWRDSVWTPERGLGFADDYKKDTLINVFNLNGSREYTWTLYGSWPQSVRDGELSYTRSDAKFVEVVVVYDWADTDSAIIQSDNPRSGSDPLLVRDGPGSDPDFEPRL